jgi:integrase
MIEEFRVFLEIDRQLAPKTIRGHVRYIKRLIAAYEYAGLDEIRKYMKGYMKGSVSGYSNALKAVRIFFRDFIGQEELIKSFKFPATPFKPRIVPEREELRTFYDEITSIEGKLYFLLYASSGLRRNEGLSLRPADVDLNMRMVTPNKGVSGTKSTWISFYNKEFEELLEDFEPRRGERWIPIRSENFKRIWKSAREKTDIKITPQVLRNWFCVTHGEAGTPDRYVDAFCGRVPGSILARHYTDYSPKRLKRIYDNASLTILS